MFSFVALGSEGDFCGIDKPGATSPCNVKDGTFSKEEIKEIVNKDSAAINEIHKVLKEGKVHLYFFYSYDCPHCKKAHAFLEEVKKQYPQLEVHQYEVKNNAANVEVFKAVAKGYDVLLQGIPAIFIGDKNFVGFDENVTCKAIIREIRRLQGEAVSCPDNEIDVPMIGTINTNTISLPAFTVYIGLLDGLNPCAMWVLAFLLGLMVYARDRKKMVLVGSTFVITSGAVYFLFMIAWLNVFVIVGYSRTITICLGIVAAIMGLFNIKGLFSKKETSFVTPKGVAVIGTIMLAVLVNFIELSCTLGLPAIYTKVLSLRGLRPVETYLYIGFYNLLYVLPLIIIVAVFTYVMESSKFTETHGKFLRIISGLLMLGLGIILMIFPQILVRG